MEITEQEQVEKSIEISIEAAQGAIKRRDAIRRLFKNRDFKLIFEELYFKDEPARLVALLTDDEFLSEDRQEGLHNDMLAISGLRKFLMTVQRIGNQMENAVASSEKQLEELRNESEDQEG